MVVRVEVAPEVAGHESGGVRSIEKVQDELIGGEDDLAAWARDRDATFFLKPGGDVLPSLRAVSEWANGAGYDAGAVNIFLQAADYYLAAHALAEAHVVVTHERPPRPPRRSRSRVRASA